MCVCTRAISSQMAFPLHHPIHEHGLFRKEWVGRYNSDCRICSLAVHGVAYVCDKCHHYILHEACAFVEIPLQIENHPIHPDHPLVLESGKYSCDLCDVSHDAAVVIATPTPLEEGGTIQPFYHDHPLTSFRSKLPDCISCGACGELIPGLAYGCRSCNFFVHESCARLPREMLLHRFHPQHPLTQRFADVVKPPLKAGKVECHFCHGYSEPDCMSYSWNEWPYKVINFQCADLLLSLQDQEKEDRVAIDHFSHEHQLLPGRVEESNHPKLRCAACELKLSGEVYYCLDCTFFIHKLCADELPHDMVHYLHPEHRLVCLPKPIYGGVTFTCDCCKGNHLIRDSDHGVCRREQIRVPEYIPESKVTQYDYPYLDKLRKEIVSLEKSIEVMEKDLEASKQKLGTLKGEAREIYQKGLEG